MKYYIELDTDRRFTVEADSPIEAIAALWERRADTCRQLDDIRPDYWIHCGRVTEGQSVESWEAFWLLSQSAQFVVHHVLKSHLCPTTFEHCCQILLSHHPEQIQ